MQVTTVEDVSQRMREHNEAVSPGQPTHLTDANAIGDAVAQGDLILKIVDAVPEGYEIVTDPNDEDRQLVPDNGTPGSHHRLRSFDGVTLYRPANWGQDESDLRGPCVVFAWPNAVVHERASKPHGTVFVDAPMTVLSIYQRNLDADGRAARARD